MNDIHTELGFTQEWAVVRPNRSDGPPVWRTSEGWCRERAAFLNGRYGDGEAVLWTRLVGPAMEVIE